MTVYAEYLFIENALIGCVILHLTAMLCAVNIRTVRLVQGAVLCGIYAFIIIIPDIHPVVLTLSKAAASVLIVQVCFREKGWRTLLRYLAVFYAVTILLAGMCFFVIYTGIAGGYVGAGGFYFQNGTYAAVIIGVFLGFFCIRKLWNHIRQRAVHSEAEATVTIYVNGNTYKMKGIVDTGNFLRDPLSGRPVIIADKGRMFRDKALREQNRYRVIPYKSLGNESGMMEGVRVDRASICRGDITAEENNPVIGLYEGDLFEGKEYEAIVHPSLLLKI